jgi:hypothetical protein
VRVNAVARSCGASVTSLLPRQLRRSCVALTKPQSASRIQLPAYSGHFYRANIIANIVKPFGDPVSFTSLASHGVSCENDGRRLWWRSTNSRDSQCVESAESPMARTRNTCEPRPAKAEQPKDQGTHRAAEVAAYLTHPVGDAATPAATGSWFWRGHSWLEANLGSKPILARLGSKDDMVTMMVMRANAVAARAPA